MMMAMSRILPKFLPRHSTVLIRHRSTNPNHSQLIEVDLEPSQSDSSEPPSAEVVNLGMKKLLETIHNIMVRRAAPDWLPFRPGSSYWVPPRASHHRAGGGIEAIEKLNSSGELLSEDERMSLVNTQGWPSSAFFIQGSSPQHPIPVMELVDTDTSSSKDEPG